MPFSRRLLFLSLILFFIFVADGSASELKSNYFNISLHNEVDIYRLLNKLNINYFLHIDILSSEKTPNLENALKDTLDALYLEVSDILDIHMYNFRINIEILPDQSYLAEVLKKHSVKEGERGVYYYDKNTIYISADDLKVGMLAHEVAHAIINHYFVVPPPVKVQEVLSGYAEYFINKSIEKGALTH